MAEEKGAPEEEIKSAKEVLKEGQQQAPAVNGGSA